MELYGKTLLAEVRKMRCLRTDARPLWFWRTAAGDEIDLLIEMGPEEFIAVEAKASKLPSASHIAAFEKFTALHDEQSLKQKLVCCSVSESRPITVESEAKGIPLWELKHL